MKQIASLAIISAFVAFPAWAGETFVQNKTVHRTNRTETSLDINTVTNSNRTEHYNSYSEKIFLDGNFANQSQSSNSSNSGFQQQFVNNNAVLKLSNISLNDNNYAEAYKINNPTGLTIHRSGSSLEGTFIEDTTTRVTGTVYSVTNETFRSHETTAGVR